MTWAKRLATIEVQVDPAWLDDELDLDESWALIRETLNRALRGAKTGSVLGRHWRAEMVEWLPDGYPDANE